MLLRASNEFFGKILQSLMNGLWTLEYYICMDGVMLIIQVYVYDVRRQSAKPFRKITINSSLNGDLMRVMPSFGHNFDHSVDKYSVICLHLIRNKKH